MNLITLEINFKDIDSNPPNEKVYLSNEMQNLINLKIEHNNEEVEVKNESSIIIVIPTQLLKNIINLALKNSKIEICETENNQVALYSLKNLEFSDNKYTNENVEIECPNLHYLNCKYGDSEIFLKETINSLKEIKTINNKNLDKIFSKYKHSINLRLLSKNKTENNSNLFELTVINNDNNFKYEIRKAQNSQNGEYFYKESWFSQNSYNQKRGELGNYEQVYMLIGKERPIVNIFTAMKNENYSIQNIDKKFIKN